MLSPHDNNGHAADTGSFLSTKECYSCLLSKSDIRILSTPHLKARLAICATSGKPSTRLPLEELAELLETVESAGYSGKVEVDLSIARGLDYYTGTIYETFVTEREGYGSVMSGGRYDTLLGMFLKQSVPAVGISLGVDRLLSVLEDLQLVDARHSVADVYVALADDAGFSYMANAARSFRAHGLNVEQALKTRKLSKQFKTAHSRGIRWVAVAGEEERAEGVIGLKDMVSGEQVSVALQEAPAWLTAKVRP